MPPAEHPPHGVERPSGAIDTSPWAPLHDQFAALLWAAETSVAH